jgi:hypothetical protein
MKQQQRLVEQYQHQGKRRAILSGLESMTNHPGFAVLRKTKNQ